MSYFVISLDCNSSLFFKTLVLAFELGRSLPQTVEHCLVCSGLMESLIMPLQEQIDDWKKTAVHLDKDHAHGMLYFVSNIHPSYFHISCCIKLKPPAPFTVIALSVLQCLHG